MDPAGLGPAPGVLDVIVEAVARDLVSGVALHDVTQGVMALVQVGERAAVGVLAMLSELLPARERLGALTLGDPDSVGLVALLGVAPSRSSCVERRSCSTKSIHSMP